MHTRFAAAGRLAIAVACAGRPGSVIQEALVSSDGELRAETSFEAQ